MSRLTVESETGQVWCRVAERWCTRPACLEDVHYTECEKVISILDDVNSAAFGIIQTISDTALQDELLEELKESANRQTKIVEEYYKKGD